jgi:hypothetical protein
VASKGGFGKVRKTGLGGSSTESKKRKTAGLQSTAPIKSFFAQRN